MARVHRFEATIRSGARGGAYVELPARIDEALGGRGRTPIEATFDGEPYRGSIVTMGGIRMLGVVKGIRAAIGKAPGDRVTVTLRRDDEERTVQVPAELRLALDAEPAAREYFDGLAYTHRREFANWIAEAKRSETTARRVEKTLALLRQRKTQ